MNFAKLSLLLKCVVTLIIFAQFGNSQMRSGQPPSSGLISCHKEVNGSRRQCGGLYCYKMLLTDEETGKAKVKKGCLNGLDAQTKVGVCTSRTHENDLAEMMCVCNDRDMCNSTPSITLFGPLLILVTVLFYNVF